MEHGITEVSTEQVSLKDFYETSVESLGIPEKERKLYRVFVEEKKPVIEHLWSTFRAEQASRTKDDWTPVMWTRIGETPLSNRAKNALGYYDIILVGHLVGLTRKKLLEFRSLGPCTLHEITKFLATMGLELASD